MTPVRPPNRKVVRKPIVHSIGVSNERDPPHIVPIQLKNFTPVGTAIKNVMPEKKARLTSPVTNMWWAHTATDRIAMPRSEEHTSELQSLMRISYAVFCLKKKKKKKKKPVTHNTNT